MSLIQEYIDTQNSYQKKYGDKTIVLMEVGSFFEIYGIDEKKGKIHEVVDITNLSISKKQDKFAPVSIKNPLMAGFPNHSFDKWKNILLRHGYTIVKIEQDSHGTKNPKRCVTDIISPGVNVDVDNSLSNSLISIYLEEIKDFKTKLPMLYLGLSIIDVTTGQSTVYETHSNQDDYKFVLDEIFRFIQTYNPLEIIFHICNKLSKINYNEIISYLEIESSNIHYNIYSEDDFLLKNNFKNEILRKVYPNTGVLNPIEYIDLEKMPWGLNSFIYLIQFTYEHNEQIIEKLEKPKIWECMNYLILSHDTINQLNLIPDKNRIFINSINSLWDIIDKTVCSMGRRLLKDNLLNPILDIKELNKRYNLVEELQLVYKNKNIYMHLQDKIKNICDIDRLHRKMAVNMMNPYQFINLDLSYYSILNIIKEINTINNKLIKDIIPDDKILDAFKNFISDYSDKIKLNLLTGINLSNMKINIFKKGIYPEIDDLQKKIDDCYLYFEKLSIELSKINKSSEKSKKIVELKFNDRDGHYLSTTKTRGNYIKNNLNIEINFNINNNSKIKIKKEELIFKSNTTTMKITSSDIKSYSHKLISYQEKIKKISFDKFSELCQIYYAKYNSILKIISKFIAYLDFLCSISKVSSENCYIKPEIIDKKESYIEAIDLRHPIIEKINNQVKYVPNDVNLNNDHTGILLYGVNAVGKSSYMKSVGLSIILAQSGCYVPAKSFKYSPFKHLFTRISNNDNIFKGQSTFAVEMSELRAILKRCNNNSLVLGDELCSGTETISGLAIVTAGVLRLSEKNTKFIFATHLHKLSSMEEIIECKNVDNYHMETTYDNVSKKLIYNRKLKLGSGNSIYGLEVAKAMDLDKKFIEKANEIRKKLMNLNKFIVNNNTSHFNSNIIISKCAICKKEKTDDIHHIREQHLADKDGIIEDFHKNNLFNLVQLCKQCHYEVHHGNLIIEGYKSTNEGIILEYKYQKKNNSKKKKYNSEQVKFINDISKNIKKISSIKLYLQKHGHEWANNISVSTIRKIIGGKY